MHFWQSLFLCEGEHIHDVAKHCERVGFRGVMLSDRLIQFEEQRTKGLHSPDVEEALSNEETMWPDAWSLFGALAAITTKLRFCTNVHVLPLRHPIEVAKATGSLAYFSGGRLQLGVGVGASKQEFDLMGVDFGTRGKRCEESIQIIRKLHSGTFVEHLGEYYQFPRVIMTPSPPTPVPVLIGGASDRALRRAARLGDGWISPGGTIEQEIELLSTLSKLRREYGTYNRHFDAIVAVAGDRSLTRAEIHRLEDAGATGCTIFPFQMTIGPRTTLAQKCAQLDCIAEQLISKS